MDKSIKPGNKTLDKIEELHRRISSLEMSGKTLKRERKTLYSLLDSIPGFVFIRAHNYSIGFANRYFIEYFGEPGERHCYEVMAGRKGPCENCKILNVYDSRKPQSWEWTSRINRRIYQIYDYPFLDLEGHLMVLEFGIDITEVKEKDEWIKVLSEREKERVDLISIQSRKASMGEMIGNIAHEWRQPLNIIAMMVQELKQIYDKGEITREYLDECVNTVMDVIQYMSQTIEDFSNFFSPEKEKSSFSVLESINRSISFMKPELNRMGIAVEIDVAEDFSMVGYPNEYAHVLLNIVKNAKDILVERMVSRPKITIRAFREGDRGIVTIADNGGGIPEGHIDRIFDPYFTTKNKGIGIGIGLYMSKFIIENNMDGRLSARNVNEGAEFRIEV